MTILLIFCAYTLLQFPLQNTALRFYCASSKPKTSCKISVTLFSTRSLQNILASEKQQQFKQNIGNTFLRSTSQSAYWLKLTVQNQLDEPFWIELGSTFLWYIDYDTLENGVYKLTTQTGSLRPHTQKSYPTNLFWLPLPIASVGKQERIITQTQENKAMPLTEEDKTMLLPYLPQLEGLEVYFNTEIERILRTIDFKNERLQAWVAREAPTVPSSLR